MRQVSPVQGTEWPELYTGTAMSGRKQHPPPPTTQGQKHTDRKSSNDNAGNRYSTWRRHQMSEPTAAAPLVSATTLADLPIRLAELVEYVLELTVQVDRISDRLEKFIMAAAATAPADTGNGQRRAQPAKYPGRLFTRARLRGDGSSRYVNEAAALYAVVKGADVEYADLEPCHDAETWRWQIKAVTA